MSTLRVVPLMLAAFLLAALGTAQAVELRLLHVSYDAMRDAFNEYNQVFAQHYRQLSGDAVSVTQINGGAADQARRVAGGMPADIVTLASSSDIEFIRERSGRIAESWKQDLPFDAQPFSSPMVFLVRAGNPRGLHDWQDLMQEGVGIVTCSPLTSGFGRYNYLGIYTWADRRHQGDEAAIRRELENFYAHVTDLEWSSDEAFGEFVLKNRGDVLLTWENVALEAVEKFGQERYQIVIPPLTPAARPRVAVLTGHARDNGTLAAAEAYARFMFSAEGQRVLASHHLRPVLPEVEQEYSGRFAAFEPVTIGDYGSVSDFNRRHFHHGGWFEEIWAHHGTVSAEGTPQPEAAP